MSLSEALYKIKRRIWNRIVDKAHNRAFYPKLYRSYWHALLHKPEGAMTENNYYSAVPNKGAGIGHQLANWIAGYWFAQQFGLRFAHVPFSHEKWEDFLGFGEGEVRAEELIKKHGYRKVSLPLFNEFNPDEVDLIKKIINSYRDRHVVFFAEADQFYKDQYGVMADLKRKFYAARARKNNHFVYSKEAFNIAVHIRRGDVAKQNSDLNLQMRWQDNSYFLKVLSLIIDNLKVSKPVEVYIFSNGEERDFVEFRKFKNIHFCLDMPAHESFLHMVYADLLVTSKSSFSYKPALLSRGIKVCPRNFWHSYPKTEDWILVEDDGIFDISCLGSKR